MHRSFVRIGDRETKWYVDLQPWILVEGRDSDLVV